ncbi:MAG: Ig-like domain-containing protein [Bacteroidota bacterium]|nr:Ig-like domain-containing protein [Bacteroidota bacterium]
MIKTRFRNLLLILIGASGCYLFSLGTSGCAQIGTPTGGPRDTIPPVLLNATPPNRTLNFKANKVVFTFDEYVHLQGMQDQLLVSPTPKTIPNITSKLKTVTIKIRDTLEPNTTYRYDFGNAIQDIDENNPLRNFSYIFSTGRYIDSLEFSGKVSVAETGKTDSTLLVMLYRDLDDSAVLKHKPRYLTRLNGKGEFTFYNLAPGTYHVYALDDQSGQRVYSNPDEMFAFLDSTVTVSLHTAPVTLWAYQETKPKPRQAAATPETGKEKVLKYYTSLTSARQDLLTPMTLGFKNRLKDFDSAAVQLTDTLFHPIPHTQITLDSTGKQITIAHAWTAGSYYRLVIQKNFAKDSLGLSLLKSDTLKFRARSESDYGSITLTFKNLEKVKKPVLQFVANDQVVKSYPITSHSWSIKLFEPGDYEIRILDDRNGNGIWDPGNYHLKLQPERVISLPKKLNIRADWENESDIIL